VKVTPDWRFIIFSGSVRQDPSAESAELNLWVVGAVQKHAEQVAPIFSANQMMALEAQCGARAADIFAEAKGLKFQLEQEKAQDAQQKQSAKAKEAELQRLTEEARKDKIIAARAAKLAKEAEDAAQRAQDKARYSYASVRKHRFMGIAT